MAEITLLPVGSIEEHGYLPVDTDTLIARAFCSLLEQQMGVIVEKPIDEAYCPSTFLFEKTKANRFMNVFSFILDRVKALIESGRRYIILINIHGGNDAVLKAVVQEIYMSRQLPLFYFNPYFSFAGKLNEECFSLQDNSFKECSLLMASLEILSMQPISGPSSDECVNHDPSFLRLKKAGVLGFSYRQPCQHVAWRCAAKAEYGHKYFKETLELFLPLIDDFKEYVDNELAKKK